MWHEARRQEKQLRERMVDTVKRHERRRQHYQSIRSDPEQYMQLHGRKCTIHMDAEIARAADASSIMRKWQGSPDVLIDRFDARAHLDSHSERVDRVPALSEQAEVEEILCDFERYRILVVNELRGADESEHLRRIAANEFWLSSNTPTPVASSSHHGKQRAEMDKKKKSTEPKAAIRYTYEDTTTMPGSSKRESTPSDDELDDLGDESAAPDVEIDVNAMNVEKRAEATRICEQYGRLETGFLELLKIDQREQKESAQIRELDKTKLSLTGRHAKADRARLKRERASLLTRVAGSESTVDMLTRLLRADQKSSRSRRRSSSSSAVSDADVKPRIVTARYGSAAAAASRAPPPISLAQNESPQRAAERQRLLALKNRRSESPTFGNSPIFALARGRDSSASPSPSPAAIQQPPTAGADQASPSVTGSNGASSSRRRRSSTSSSRGLAQATTSSRRCQRSRSSSRSSSSRRSDEPLEVRSSMSEEEKECREIENRKRRVQRTERLHSERRRRRSSTRSNGGNDGDQQKSEAAQRLRRQMRRQLDRRAAQLRSDERDKARENEQRQRERDVIVSDEARALRQRQQTRDDSNVRSPSPPRRRRRHQSSSSSTSSSTSSSSAHESRSRHRRRRSPTPKRDRRGSSRDRREPRRYRRSRSAGSDRDRHSRRR